MIAKLFAITLCCCAPVLANEGFETLPPGAIGETGISCGTLKAATGHAVIIAGKGRGGGSGLHLTGGDERMVTIDLARPTTGKSSLNFHIERWTSRGGFAFRVESRTGRSQSWEPLARADGAKVGGYHTRVSASLPEGSTAVRFVCSSAAGVLIDDLAFEKSGPMELAGFRTAYPAHPVLRRKEINEVAKVVLTTQGDEKPLSLDAVELSLAGTTHPSDIARIEILPPEGTGDGKALATTTRVAQELVLKPSAKLSPGENAFRVSVVLKDDADPDGRVCVTVGRVKAAGQTLDPREAGSPPPVPQRIGIALRMQGDDGSHSYRIPGLARTKAGTLLAVYDIRYKHCGDLPALIDVGVSRSTSGGKEWEDMRIAMHAGTMGKPYERDGVGDPAILADPVTGRIWIAALWSHGNRAWNHSGPGMTPDETGQFLLTHSDDDGKTWSPMRNITPQVKDPAWRLVFNGPGAGIRMHDGTLVFPAQFRAANGGDTQGKPFSTVITSKDHGETWNIGSGARIDTTEAQVVETEPGTLMLNCRDNRGGSRTVVTSRDLGKTWTPHPTDRGALPEPVCMASLLRWDHPSHGTFFAFSNPAATDGRHNLTVKISRDMALTWPASMHTLYDPRRGSGYSCLAPADDDHLGVLYEGPCEMYFMRLPLAELLK
jgi:sialidase-1